MLALLSVAMTSWLCALLAIPRTPRRDNEVAQFIHRRLVGRHHLLVALAAAVTLVAGCSALCTRPGGDAVSPAETHLLAVTLAAATCWTCRALCQPRSVPFVRPTTAMGHLQALGGQRRLTPLATLLTVSALVALLALPASVHPDLRDLRLAAATCAAREDALRDRPGLQDIITRELPPCYVLQPGGVWAVEEVRSDGIRRVVGR
jgi:hypothetical protein